MRRFPVILLTLLLGVLACPAHASHPQDGPHADLRIAIEDRSVRFSVGVNLAFLDETTPLPREAISELSKDEAARVLDAFERLLRTQAPCLINGTPVPPEFERLEIFAEPDPGMVSLFPRMGNLALIRATAVMRFDPDDPVETAEITWPAYPVDQLAEQLESGAGVRPRMYFEVVFTAEGRSHAARFTHAEPTIHWSRSDEDAPDPLASLPQPTLATPGNTSPLPALALGGLGVIAILLALAPMRSSRGRLLPVGVGLIAMAVLVQLIITTRSSGEDEPLLSEEQATEIFLALHSGMYRAFDYTSESDIYDRLATALDEELLGTLYEQIRLSLLQAEEEMKVGVVTGLSPIETRIERIDPAGESAEGLGFEVRHRWRVDGTVYHWGHSHTRAHLYEGLYRVVFTPAGWRIREHELIAQQRIDPSEGTPIEPADPLREQMEELGLPDL